MESKWWSHIPNIDFLPVIIAAEPNEDDDEDEDQQGSTGGAGEPNSTKTGEGEGGEGDNPQVKIKNQEEIINKFARQKREQDAELEELRKFKKEQDDAKLSEKEKRDRELAEAQERIDALTEGQRKLVVKTAFLESSDYEWHNPATALKLVDLNGIEIEEKDGELVVKDESALKERIKTLATDNPFLLKRQGDNGDDDKNKDGKSKFEGRTGQPPAGKKKSEEATRRSELLKKYPNLRK